MTNAELIRNRVRFINKAFGKEIIFVRHCYDERLYTVYVDSKEHLVTSVQGLFSFLDGFETAMDMIIKEVKHDGV